MTNCGASPIAICKASAPGHVLQTTELVNEAYLRLVASCQDVTWQNRAQFFALAAQQMRRVLVDIARAHVSQRRGGGAQQVELDETMAGSALSLIDLLALDEALQRLARIYPRKERVVVLKFFGSFSDAAAAAMLQSMLSRSRRTGKWPSALLRLSLPQPVPTMRAPGRCALTGL